MRVAALEAVHELANRARLVARERGEPRSDAGLLPIASAVTLTGAASSDADDGDAITYRWAFVARPAGSTAVLPGDTTAAPSFTADVPGDYVAQLVVTDPFGAASAPGTVTVSANRPPVAVADIAQTTQDIAVDVPVLTNDSDPDGDPVGLASFTQAAHGGLAVAGPGSLRCTPEAGFSGPDAFSYVVSDGRSGSASAIVCGRGPASDNGSLCYSHHP